MRVRSRVGRFLASEMKIGSTPNGSTTTSRIANAVTLHRSLLGRRCDVKTSSRSPAPETSGVAECAPRTLFSGSQAALDDTYKAWEQITERFGREGQKKLYQASFVS
jgi:hypothetical protein